MLIRVKPDFRDSLSKKFYSSVDCKSCPVIRETPVKSLQSLVEEFVEAHILWELTCPMGKKLYSLLCKSGIGHVYLCEDIVEIEKKC